MDRLLEIREKYKNSKQVLEEIYQTLYDAIINDIYKCGDRLTEEDLAAVFDVSRTPVREAIKRLEYDGIVSYSKKGGYQIRTFSSTECIEIMEAMEYMGQIATRVAANIISNSSLIQLADNIERSRKATEEKEKYFYTNEFHRIIVKSINNPQFYDAYMSLYQKFIFLSNRYPYISVDVEIIEDHVRIYEALVDHDAERAWNEILEHSKKTMSFRIRRFLQ